MNGFDDRHAAPPTVGPSAGRRVRGRPRHSGTRLTRGPRGTAESAESWHGQNASAAAAGSLVEWHAMSEPEYVLAWEQLREWTAWLIGRYRLVLEDRLPGCWPQHPELIEELWALRAWRIEAYGPEGTGQSAVYWQQALVTFLGHVAGWWAGGCRAGHTGPDVALSPEQTRAWEGADPLAGVPQPMRPSASIRTDPADDQKVITMPDVNILTAPQMRALTNAGLAQPQHETILAFTRYDESWWAFTSDEDARWIRADDADLDSDGTLFHQPSTAD